MTRKLGTFNNRQRLEKRESDYRRRREDEVAKNPAATLGYSMGLFRNKLEREEPDTSNAEKFVRGSYRPSPGNTRMRMAGVELRNQLQ